MNADYPLFPVAIITLLAYFTTRVFVHWKIFKVNGHRKFWNYLLLITFLVSGLLGLLSVVKVNYKLEIPNYDTYLQWHVSFGITMVIIAFFHLSWHLKYYFQFRITTQKASTGIPEFKYSNSTDFRVLLFLLGVVTIISQVVFIREFISVLSGNELIVGVVMAAWMLLTGWGALHAKTGSFGQFTVMRGITMLTALTLFPMVLIALLYLLKNLLFPPGTLIGMGYSVLAAFVLLFPVCFLSGYLFTAFSTLLSETNKTNLLGKSYSVESLGSLFGGLIFSIIFGRFFSSFQVFGISTAMVLFSGAWLIHKNKKRLKRKLIVAGVLVPVLIFFLNPEKFINKISFPNQEILTSQSTRYGNLVLTERAGQFNVYENNNLQFYTDNIMLNEEAVHFAMVQHKNPKNVLLVSGGIAGMVAEIQKYGVDKITYLETNPEIFDVLEKFEISNFDSENVEIIKKDIRKFIGSTEGLYDVILLNLPPPASLGLNRFYTEEFFRLLKKNTTKETVVLSSLTSLANYAEENVLLANSSLWKTLGIFFENRLLLTGEKTYFLASDSPLSSAITQKIAKKNIPTEYVNQYYLDDMLLSMRSKTFARQFTDSVPVNRDFYPYLFVKQISHWLSHFKTGYKLLVLFPVVLFLLFFARTNRITAGLYTGGFTAASLEITLLLAYQVYFGSIYLTTALFFAAFMAGLAFGSSLKTRNKVVNHRNYYLLQFGLALLSILLPFLIRFSGETMHSFTVQTLFFVLIFALATGIGFEFLLASKLQDKSYSHTSGINYSTDLAGSALGSFLTAIVLLPLLGVLKTCLVVAVLNVISGLMAFSAGKSGIFST